MLDVLEALVLGAEARRRRPTRITLASLLEGIEPVCPSGFGGFEDLVDGDARPVLRRSQLPARITSSPAACPGQRHIEQARSSALSMVAIRRKGGSGSPVIDS